MSPTRQYPHETIAHALTVAYSFNQAAGLVGMNASAMRKRCRGDKHLEALALACIARGQRLREPSARTGVERKKSNIRNT